MVGFTKKPLVMKRWQLHKGLLIGAMGLLLGVGMGMIFGSIKPTAQRTKTVQMFEGNWFTCTERDCIATIKLIPDIDNATVISIGGRRTWKRPGDINHHRIITRVEVFVESVENPLNVEIIKAIGNIVSSFFRVADREIIITDCKRSRSYDGFGEEVVTVAKSVGAQSDGDAP